MALNDWYQVLDKQESAGQSILNVYHVQRETGTEDAEDIFHAFDDSVLPSILPAQPTNLEHSEISVENLDDPLDFFAGAPTSSTGTLTGEGLSTFVAATLMFIRKRTDMKNGMKRIMAGTESSIAVNIWTSGLLLLLETLGDAIVLPWEQLSDPGTIVCRFGIIKRVCTVQPPPTPCPSYRLPENDSELVFYTPTTFIVRSKARSQVSRKRLV